jgi:hypothetical protein
LRIKEAAGQIHEPITDAGARQMLQKGGQPCCRKERYVMQCPCWQLDASLWSLDPSILSPFGSCMISEMENLAHHWNDMQKGRGTTTTTPTAAAVLNVELLTNDLDCLSQYR